MAQVPATRGGRWHASLAPTAFASDLFGALSGNDSDAAGTTPDSGTPVDARTTGSHRLFPLLLRDAGP